MVKTTDVIQIYLSGKFISTLAWNRDSNYKWNIVEATLLYI